MRLILLAVLAALVLAAPAAAYESPLLSRPASEFAAHPVYVSCESRPLRPPFGE